MHFNQLGQILESKCCHSRSGFIKRISSSKNFDTPLNIVLNTLSLRTHCSLFDVSHMLQTRVWGRDRAAFMESLTTADVEMMATNTGSLTVFTNDKGMTFNIFDIRANISDITIQ